MEIAKKSPDNKIEEDLESFLTKKPFLDFSDNEKETLKLIFDFIRDMRLYDREILTEIKEIVSPSIKPQTQHDINSHKLASKNLNLIGIASKVKLNESKARAADYLLKIDEEATLDELVKETGVHRTIISGFLAECGRSGLIESTRHLARGPWKKEHRGKVNYYKFVDDSEVRRILRQKINNKLSR